jgi:hypothetical protein
MKDSILTIRVTKATRQRLVRLARREGRSLSGQVERLLERSLGLEASRSLAGVLAGGRTPTLADFKEARSTLSASLGARTRRS